MEIVEIPALAGSNLWAVASVAGATQSPRRDRMRGMLLTLCIFFIALPFASGQAISRARTQTDIPAAPHPHPIVLPGTAEDTLAGLAAIDQLPADEWRIHPGDLPHGESPSLDDSSWPEVKGPYLGSTEAMWFRRTIVVPAHLHGYDLTGANINFAFDIWAEGPVPIIVYFNGRRVAMGEAMEPISLLEDARPGDKVVVAIKALDSADAKHFRQANLDIEFPRSRPNPQTFRLEALSATYLLPALLQKPSDADEIKKDAAIVESAIAAVDLKAMHDGNQSAFDSSLKTATARLEMLRPLIAQAGFYLTGNAHIDAAWVWPWTETVDVARRTFSTALQLMREYPSYTYSQSQVAYYEWMAEKYAPIQKEIAARIKEGRWEAVGGMWVEPDLNLLDGESMVRQLLVGTRYLKQEYGATVRVGWNPDTFGYTWQLPQIYNKSGIDYFVTQKMAWNETNQLPLKLFYWQSPDGSRVLTYFPHDYNNKVLPDKLAIDFNVAREQNPGLPEMLHLYGVGDHGGGPTRSMLDMADSWMEKDKIFGAMRYGTAEPYLASMQTRLDIDHAPVWNYATLAADEGKLPEPSSGKVSVPVWNDELYLEYTRGVYTTHAEQKRNMRESEEWMLDAEKWSALDWVAGAKYPATELTEAWKKVLFNQFHDIAAGSGVGILYKDAQRDYSDVHLVTASAQNHALGDLASYIDTTGRTVCKAGEDAPLIVWNSLAWARTDVVTAEVQLPAHAAEIEIVDSTGKVMPSQSIISGVSGAKQRIQFLATEVPSLGYRVFCARPAKQAAPSELKARGEDGKALLENNSLRVTIDLHDGCITHLVDKKTGFDSIAASGCGNQLQTFTDLPHDYDAWNVDPGTFDHPTALDHLDSAALIETGPLRATVRTTRTWQHSKIAQNIVLYAGLDRVDISSDVDWHEQHVLLKAAVPLAASGPMATYEIPYGSIERPTTRNNSWEAAKFEVPAMRWADLGDASHGFSLLNEAKYGYDAKDNVLRLTLLRSPTAPDPLADQGEHSFQYSFYPHALGWKQAETEHRGYEFNYELAAMQVEAHTGPLPPAMSFIRVGPSNLVLTAVKKSEDGAGLLLRFYEWAGKSGTATVTVPGGFSNATLTNLMETPEAGSLAVSSGTISVPFSPFSIVTLRVEYPKQAPALLSRSDGR